MSMSVTGSGYIRYEKTVIEASFTSTSMTVKKGTSLPEEDPKDVFEKTYAADPERVSAIKSEFNSQVSTLKKMVEALMGKQAGCAGTALLNLQKLIDEGRIGKHCRPAGKSDEEIRLEAEAMIGEDGYFGVEQTSKRILDFAKALAGDDPSRADLMRGAFEAGYAAAEKIWGGELPDICKQTYDRVMAGFDEWENPTE